VKILILNQDWFADELRELGHEVITCGSEPHLEHQIPVITSDIESVIASLNGFVPDVILWHDNSMPTFLMSGLESSPIPIVFYSVDTFHHAHMHALMAEVFDHVFVAQKDNVRVFDGCGTPATWLPLWAPRYVEASDRIKWPVSFFGNLNAKLNPRRVEFFEKLQHQVPINIAHGNYWEHFPFSEIVVNQTVKGDLNFRVFEAMMCGALLLTERTPNGLFEIFREGEHLITYTPDSVEEATDKVHYLLAHPEQMRQIAHAGREEILARHLPKHRAQLVHEILSTVKKRNPAKDRHFRAMVNHALTTLVAARRSGHYHATPLTACLLAAQRGLEAREELSNTHAGYLIRACHAYDEMTNGSVGSGLLAHFATAMPTQEMVVLSAIRNLLNTGRRLEAEVIASKISTSPPHELFHHAERTIHEILSKIN